VTDWWPGIYHHSFLVFLSNVRLEKKNTNFHQRKILHNVTTLCDLISHAASTIIMSNSVLDAVFKKPKVVPYPPTSRSRVKRPIITNSTRSKQQLLIESFMVARLTRFVLHRTPSIELPPLVEGLELQAPISRNDFHQEHQLSISELLNGFMSHNEETQTLVDLIESSPAPAPAQLSNATTPVGTYGRSPTPLRTFSMSPEAAIAFSIPSALSLRLTVMYIKLINKA